MPTLVKPQLSLVAPMRRDLQAPGSPGDLRRPISRRSFLQFGAAAGAAILPRRSPASVSTRLRFRNSADSIVIDGPGLPPWSLDKAAFGPNVECALKVLSATCRELTVVGTGSPLSEHPTDIRLRFEKKQVGWRVSSRCFGAHSSGSVCAREWLSGLRDLDMDDSSFRSTKFAVGNGGARFSGNAMRVTLRSDLTLQFLGRRVCEVQFPDSAQVSAEHAQLRLITPDRSIVSGETSSAILRLSVESGRRRWPSISLENDLPSPFEMNCPLMRPAVVHIDLAAVADEAAQVMAINGPAEGTFTIRGPLSGPDGGHASLPVNDASLIHAVRSGDVERVLLASLGDSAGYSFRAAGFEATVAASDLPTIQVVASKLGSDPLHVYVTAKSCALAIPVHDAFVHIVATAAGTGLKISPAGTGSPGADPLSATSTVSECAVEVSPFASTLDLSGVRLSVLRAVDFMAMDFTFRNLLVQSTLGSAHLIRGREVAPPPSGTVHPPPPPPGILITHFQPQALREQTTYQQNTDNEQICPANPCDVKKLQLSQSTRLAFEIPASILDGKPSFSMATLLRWEEFNLRVDDRAQSRVPVGFLKRPTLPADDVTSMDFFGLHFSPNELAQWRHHKEPLNIGKRVQLYHGLLFDGEAQEDKVGLRAIYGTNYSANDPVPEHSCSLGTGTPPIFSASEQDQNFLVQLMSDFGLVDQASQHNYVPIAMALDYLCLSALGGSMKGHAAFTAPILQSSPGNDKGIDIESLTHESAFWRLDLEEIKYRYFAFPFSFRISIVKKTARAVYKAENPLDPPLNMACLRTQLFVEWVEPSIDFLTRPLPYAATVNMPFAIISIDEKAKRSPPIDDPCLGKALPYQPDQTDPAMAFWPMVDGEPLLLHMIGRDVGGQVGHGNGTASFALPFIAVKATQALRFNPVDDPVLAAVKKYYRDTSFPEVVARRTVDTHGQYIHYSPVLKAGDSEFQTYDLLFDYDDVPAVPSLAQTMLSHYWPRFVPAVAEAVVTVPAVEHMTGISRVAVSYASVYLNNGIGSVGAIPPQNKGQVTLNLLREAPPPAQLRAKSGAADRWIATSKGRGPAEWAQVNYAPPGVGMPFPGGKSGGVMSPGLVMKGFSPPSGPIGGDINKYAGGTVVSQSFYDKGAIDFAAKLVGDIFLADVLPPEILEFSKTLEKIPTFIHQAISEITNDLLEPLIQIEAKIAAAQEALTAFTKALAQPLITLERQADSTVRCKLVSVGDQLQAKLFKNVPSAYLPAAPAWAKTWQKTRERLANGQACPAVVNQVAVLAPPAAGTKCEQRCAAATTLDELLTGLVDSLQELAGADALLQADIQLVIDVFAKAAGSSVGWLTDSAEQIADTFQSVAAGAPLDEFVVALVEPLSKFDVGKALDDLKSIVSQSIQALQGAGRFPVGDDIQRLTKDIEGLLNVAPSLSDLTALSKLVTAPFDSFLLALNKNFADARKAFTDLAKTVEDQLKNTIPAQFQGVKQVARDCLKVAADRAKAIILDDLIAQILDQAVPILVQALSSDLIQGASQDVIKLVAEGQALISQLLGFVADAQAILDELRHPRLVKVDYVFHPDLCDWPADSPIFVAQADGQAADLQFNVHIEIPFDPQHPDKTTPHIAIDGQLNNFILVFLPSLEFIRIQFSGVSFHSVDGSTPDVKVHVSKVSLGSALEFLSAFQSFMQFGGDGNGPYLKLTPQDVRAGYQYSKPEMTIGAFIIRNLGFDAHVELSFENGPLIGAFSFASESKRFNLSYGIYGGGGYFTIRAAPSYIDSLAIALEGGVFSDFDCGAIASGTAHAVIGFLYAKSRQSCEFRGYFDAAASLEVLGLIHAAIGFYLGLSYVSSGNGSGKTAGVCIVTVDIDMCLWTMHVDVTCYREFSNSGGKSQMRGLMSPAHNPSNEVGPGTENYIHIWNAYEAAFN